jgi:GTPase Era involved in 16S rRNA processing
VRQWKHEVTEWALQSGLKDIPVILFANKCDMMDKHTDPQVAFKLGAMMERLCSQENFLAWFITSARSGECVEEGFNVLVDRIMTV